MYTYLLDLFLANSEIATDWIIALSFLGFSISATIIGLRIVNWLKSLYLLVLHGAAQQVPVDPPQRKIYPWHLDPKDQWRDGGD